MQVRHRPGGQCPTYLHPVTGLFAAAGHWRRGPAEDGQGGQTTHLLLLCPHDRPAGALGASQLPARRGSADAHAVAALHTQAVSWPSQRSKGSQARTCRCYVTHQCRRHCYGGGGSSAGGACSRRRSGGRRQCGSVGRQQCASSEEFESGSSLWAHSRPALPRACPRQCIYTERRPGGFASKRRTRGSGRGEGTFMRDDESRVRAARIAHFQRSRLWRMQADAPRQRPYPALGSQLLCM